MQERHKETQTMIQADFYVIRRRKIFKQAMNGGGGEISQILEYSPGVCETVCVYACIQMHLPIVLPPCMKIQASHKHRHTSEKIHLSQTTEVWQVFDQMIFKVKFKSLNMADVNNADYSFRLGKTAKILPRVL